MRSQDYWLKREKARIVNAEKIGRETNTKIQAIYNQSLRAINKEINTIYTKYSDKVGLDVNELSSILKPSERTMWTLSIQKKMKDLGFVVDDVYNAEFIRKLTRLEALKQQIYWEIIKIAPEEQLLSTRAYTKIIEQGYTYTMKGFEKMGVDFTFSTLNKEVINTILTTNWAGRNYVDSIWNNVTDFANKLPTKIAGDMAVGKSSVKIANEIAKEYKAPKYKATRLVRTETNYFANQTHLQANLDAGFEKYQYQAVLDGRTSQICSETDDDIFNFKDAQVGKNYPPLHANCRSYTITIFD